MLIEPEWDRLQTTRRQEAERALEGEGSRSEAQPGRAYLLTQSRIENLERIRGEIKEIDEQMTSLKDRRNMLVSQRERLRRLVHYTPSDAGVKDDLFVDPKSLRPMIEEFCSIHGRGAIKMLAEKAQVTSKSIWRIRTNESKKVSLNIADRILIALGKQGEISNMEIFKRIGPTKGMVSLDVLNAIADRDEAFLQMPY